MASLRAAVADKTGECSRLEQDLEQLRVNSEHLEQLLRSKEEECQNLGSRLSQLQADQDLASSSYAQSMADLRSQHGREVEDLRDEARKVGEAKEAAESELEISEQECAELKSKLDQVRLLRMLTKPMTVSIENLKKFNICF
jgi:predicted  nucleic acid-binding Zn-ribbon protein